MSLLETDNYILKLYLVGILIFGIGISLIQSAHTNLLRQQAERSAAENQAKDEFLRTISHELRTPMHAVVSSGELLNHTQLSSRQHSYVDKLMLSSRHMLALIDDLLSLAKIEMSPEAPKTGPFHLPAFLDQTRALLADSFTATPVALRIEDRTGLEDCMLLGDQTSLRQVLINLLHNARKFTEQGEVRLTVSLTRTQQEPGYRELRFAVTDTGIGIPVEEQEKLFRPFYRVHNDSNTRHQGSGLGLAISQKLVRLLGGELKLRSQPGKGSCFYFTLRLGCLEQVQEQTVQPQAPAVHPVFYPLENRRRILIIDDNELNRFFTQELLRNRGYHTQTAASGPDALSYLQQQSVDLILVDLNMPGMDGYETTRLIRACRGYKPCPLLPSPLTPLSANVKNVWRPA
ncbi:MAG: ATP-binding protein [Thiolinea sp.]